MDAKYLQEIKARTAQELTDDDYIRLKSEIATLKRALELACQYGERWYDSAMESREDYTPVCANMLLNNFIKQAQEES